MGKARTHCPYCALNCGLDLRVDDGTVVGIDRWKGSPLTAGSLCSKGVTSWEQVHHEDRLRRPLVNKNGSFHEVGWSEALDVAAEGFLRIRSQYGADANALLSGGSLTNEKVYLIGKFARLAMGTAHVDYNGRFCMAAAGKANTMAFGADRMMTPLEDIKKADVVVVVGAHISAAFPIALPTYLNYVRRTGGTVIVVDPRAGRFVKDGDIHVALEPGTDAVFFNGVLREIVRQGLVDRAFVDERTVGFADAVSAALPYEPELVELVADVPESTLAQVASLIGNADRCMILHGRGPEQQLDGTQNVLSMINVALACGHVGTPGSGINMLTGQRNGQGGREWGQRCDQLPAGRSIEDDDHRRVVAEHWGVSPDALPQGGRSYVEILRAAGTKDVRGLLTICTNMAVSSPDVAAVRRQLDALDHHVLIDPFLSASARQASVVLPGTTFAEESGTITTIEGRVVRIDQAIEPINGFSDLDILGALAERLGAESGFTYPNPQAIFEEMRKVTSGGPIDYAGMTYDRIRDEGGLQWPCPSEDHPGTPQLYTERFAHADGRARFHAIVPRDVPIVISEQFPLILTTGRLLAQFLSANQTGRIDRQNKAAPGPFVEIHPDTARAYSLEKGQLVRLSSEQGTVVVPWVSNRRIRHDTLFMPYHWAECNLLVADDLDPLSRIPGFKYTPVRIAPVEPRSVVDLDAIRADAASSVDSH